MRKNILRATAGLAILLAISLFFANSVLLSYNLHGHNLPTTQRDFRVYNNFTDNSANDNTTPDSDFGGTQGAVLALSKAVAEWGSETMGGSTWGTGGANFDSLYTGEASSSGGHTGNVFSEEDTYDGSVLAYCTPSYSGWMIHFIARPWVWHDGPGDTSSGGNRMDIQGIGCHEFGHSVGVDHSQYSNATMYYAVSGAGNTQRTLHSDDINGVQAKYGAASSSKPRITSISGNPEVGGNLTIYGSNFSTTGNDVWFTSDGSDGNPTKVTSVSSSSGGTRIDVTIPVGAYSGGIMIQKDATGHASLSNAYPIEIDGGTPIPDAKVNGSDGPLSLCPGQQINFTIGLDPGSQAGVTHDWWVWAQKDPPLYTPWYWKYPSTWKSSSTPVRAIAYGLISLSNYQVGSTSNLTSGNWEFVFAIDAYNNVYEGTYIDTVDVTIY